MAEAAAAGRLEGASLLALIEGVQKLGRSGPNVAQVPAFSDGMLSHYFRSDESFARPRYPPVGRQRVVVPHWGASITNLTSNV